MVAHDSPRGRLSARSIAQALGSAALLCLAWYGVNWSHLVAHVGDVEWGRWSVGVVLVVGAPLLGSLRTWTLVRSVVGHAEYGRVTRLNYGAMRFVFLPGGDVIGGVSRWFAMTKWGWAGPEVLSVLVMERVVDLAVTASVVAVGVPFWLTVDGVVRVVWIGSLITVTAITALMLMRATIERACRGSTVDASGLGKWNPLRILRRGAGATAAAAMTVLARPATAVGVASASIAYSSVALLGGALMAVAVVPGLDLGSFVLTMCVVALAAQIPISVAGVGLREAAMRVLMSDHGITPEKAALVGVSAVVPYALLACIGVVAEWRKTSDE